MQSSRSTESSVRPLVLSIHGIRTTGQWQDDLAEALDRSGFRHRPLNFGFFRATSLLLPWARQGKVDWFLKEIERKVDDDGVPPSIIAHSFGTYILTKALEKQSLLRFDRIVLCGSIVRRDYPWSTIVRGGQVNYVLNEAGGKDFWCGLVGWVVSDAGPSGVVGFDDEAGGRLLQLRHALHRHSDYFSNINYRKRWIPFLKGITPESPPKRPRSKLNLRFSSLVVALIFASALGVLTWLKNAKDNEHNEGSPLAAHDNNPLHPAKSNSQQLSSDQVELNKTSTSTNETKPPQTVEPALNYPPLPSPNPKESLTYVSQSLGVASPTTHINDLSKQGISAKLEVDQGKQQFISYKTMAAGREWQVEQYLDSATQRVGETTILQRAWDFTSYPSGNSYGDETETQKQCGEPEMNAQVARFVHDFGQPRNVHPMTAKQYTGEQGASTFQRTDIAYAYEWPLDSGGLLALFFFSRSETSSYASSGKPGPSHFRCVITTCLFSGPSRRGCRPPLEIRLGGL